MTTQDRQLLEQEIAHGISTASTFLSVFGPQFAVVAMLGQTLAKIEPTLVEDIAAIFDKKLRGEPTAEDEKGLADTLEGLLAPETL